MPNLRKKRRYEDACAAAHAMDLIGERWALLIARELMLGARRFADLKRALPGISAPVLSQRLKDLVEYGIVAKLDMPPPLSAQVYKLTEWGLELEEIMQKLGKWAAKSPRRPAGGHMSLTSLLLALRSMFSPARAVGRRNAVQLLIDDSSYVMRVDGKHLVLVEGEQRFVDATLEGPSDALAAYLIEGEPLKDLRSDGRLRTSGSTAVVQSLPGLFPLPEQVAA